MDQQPSINRMVMVVARLIEIIVYLIPGFIVGLVAGLFFSTHQITSALDQVDKAGFGICVKEDRQ